MADDFIRVPVDGVGKRVDTEEITVNSLLVHRERDQIAGVGALEIARVLNTDPTGTDYALAVRQTPPESFTVDYATSASLAAGSGTDLDATTISVASTGKLMKVTVGSSVSCRWDIKTRDGGVEVVKTVVYTSGVTGGTPTFTYRPESKEGITLAGNGVDENFRVTVTNLDAISAADVHAAIEWDEV